MHLKKICSIFLAAVLILSVFVLGVGAETEEVFKVGVEVNSSTPLSLNPKIFNSGDEISLKVSVLENTGISFLGFYIYYDTEALEFIKNSERSSELFEGGALFVNQEKGFIKYFVDFDEKISTEKGSLYELKFKAKNTFCGDLTFEAKAREADCSKYSTISKNTYVPFVSEKADFGVHSVDLEKGVITAPTCTEKGYTTYICKLCQKEVVGNFTPANGHTEVVDKGRAPTATEPGLTDGIHCSVCGEILVPQIEIPVGLKGDVNADGTVNLNDGMSVILHIARTKLLDDAEYYRAEIIDGEEGVSLNDGMYILLYVARKTDTVGK